MSDSQFEELSGRCQNEYAITRLNKDFVIKIRTSRDRYFLSTLAREGEFLSLKPSLPVRVPELVFEDFTETVGVLVFLRILGEPLSRQREPNAIPIEHQTAVLRQVGLLQGVDLQLGWKGSYARVWSVLVCRLGACRYSTGII